MPVSLFLGLNSLDEGLAALTAALLLPLGVYVLLCGMDDLLLDLLWLRRKFLSRPPGLRPADHTERRIAILIPLWQEAEVIGRMVGHNLAAIDYDDYEIFIGAYRNDGPTRAKVQELSVSHARVHLAEVPHDGPTSKADCLNWIYQQMLLHEEQQGVRFEVVVIHDAEDLIHPQALRRIARYSTEYDMVQVPVLALPTPWHEFTHGVYLDDFAESQTKDLHTRVELGAFLPGCGVGTGFRRTALEKLAAHSANRIFDPLSLTEDYDNGLRLHQLGCTQIILPLEFLNGAPLATREYFPRGVRAAIRQRSRWLAGNALQAWQRFGWGRGLRRRWVQVWFLWRDRKGLWGNPASLLCNLLLLYGAVSWAVNAWNGRPWTLRLHVGQSPHLLELLRVNAALFLSRILVRCWAVSSVYGAAFASGVPVRMVWANWINSGASLLAVYQVVRSRLTGRPLRWLKTEHAYPARSALLAHKRRLGEILVANRYCTGAQLEIALAITPPGEMLGRHMVRLGFVSEHDLYEALSLQQGVPHESGAVLQTPVRIARALPASLSRQWEVLPFLVRDGALHVASPRVPSDAMHSAIRRFTRLEIRFHLVTPSRFSDACRRLLI
ncbi:MAG: glycosyl transferase family protein [Acidobacteria bacterium]|nr:glycosyl transferase family protein [Acidobacteriota bacterium]